MMVANAIGSLSILLGLCWHRPISPQGRYRHRSSPRTGLPVQRGASFLRQPGDGVTERGELLPPAFVRGIDPAVAPSAADWRSPGVGQVPVAV
jgi:hypothetical protein